MNMWPNPQFRLYFNASLLYEKEDKNEEGGKEDEEKQDDKEADKLEGRVLSGSMKYYADDLKNVLTVPIKYAVQPKPDLKAEKEVEAKKDDKIEDIMKSQIVEWVKDGEGGIDFFNKQKQKYPDYVPLYHVSF